MRVFLVVAALVAIVWTARSSEDSEFQAWKLEFGKSYGSEEEEFQRKMTWMTNLKIILEHNILAKQGIKSYTLGLNQFSDMNHEEFLQEVLRGCSDSFNITEFGDAENLFQETVGAPALPKSVDWRKRGYVTPVKRQKDCGGCWAFSATGSLEGQFYSKTKKLIPLSEQQLIDCSRPFDNHGCKGGLAIKAFKYLKTIRGLQAEATYSYKAMDDICRYDPTKAVVKCRGFSQIPSGNEDSLKEAVASVGPISVSIDAKHYAFQHYKSGVFDEPYCTKNLGHAVLIVGYGNEKGKDFWLVKNSWGLKWGDKGYIKMSRNKKNQCGIATRAVFPLV